jgi:hypothetical protein
LNKRLALDYPPLNQENGGIGSIRFPSRFGSSVGLSQPGVTPPAEWARTEVLESHLRLYRELGLAVVPAVYGGKRPIVEWRCYQSAPPTDQQVREWFNDGRRHNVAVICGEASGNLSVLDFDDLEVYERFFTREIEEATLVVETGSGKRHVYFRTPEPLESFRIPGLRLEVRSTGNIVIAPPSLHPSGRHYRFVNMDVRDILVVDGLRESVLRRAEEMGVEIHVSPGAAPMEPKAFRLGFFGEPPCIRRIGSGVVEGFRNEAAVRLASFWLNSKGFSREDTLARLMEWNRLNRPPLPERELQAVLRSVSSRGYTYGCTGLSVFCPPGERGRCPVHRRVERIFKRRLDEL